MQTIVLEYEDRNKSQELIREIKGVRVARSLNNVPEFYQNSCYNVWFEVEFGVEYDREWHLLVHCRELEHALAIQLILGEKIIAIVPYTREE